MCPLRFAVSNRQRLCHERENHEVGLVDLFTRMIRLKAGSLDPAVFAVTPCSEEFFAEAGALQFVPFFGFARFTQRVRRKFQEANTLLHCVWVNVRDFYALQVRFAS